MLETSQNQAFDLLQDIKAFGWPVFALLVMRVLNPLSYGRNAAGRWRAVVLVGTILASMSTVFLLLLDGHEIFQIAKAHLIWGTVLALSVAAGILSGVLSWRDKRDVDSQLARGVLDTSVSQLEIKNIKPRMFAIISFVLLVVATAWLLCFARASIS